MSKYVIETGDDGFAETVLQSDVPVLVDFWAEWCPPCRAVAPAVERLAEQYAGKVKVVKVNVDENPATASRYGIKSIPTLAVFDNGAEVDRVLGLVPQSTLAGLVDARLKAVSSL